MSYGYTRAALLAAALISFVACGGGSKQAQPAAPAPAPAAAAPADGPAAAPADGTAGAPADTSAAAPAADATAQPVDDAAGAGTKITEADMEQAVTLFEGLAAAAHTSVGDCSAQAAGMQQVVDSNKDFIARMNAMKGKDPEAEKIFKEKYQDRIGKVMMGMMTDLQKCQNDPAVQKVFESLK